VTANPEYRGKLAASGTGQTAGKQRSKSTDTMDNNTKTGLAAKGVAILFLTLTAVLLSDIWGTPASSPSIKPADPVFTNTATIRISAKELFEMEADTSGMDCGACHEPGSPPEIKRDADSNVILPPAHVDLVYSRMNCAACHRESEAKELEWDDDGNTIVPAAHRHEFLQHGFNKQNNDCYNCHDKQNLAQLKLRDGRTLNLTESTLLCAGCHGPTYRDWNAGIHGRTSGYWRAESGSRDRKGCTSCHDPHSPTFPKMIPAPAPNPLHPLDHPRGEEP